MKRMIPKDWHSRLPSQKRDKKEGTVSRPTTPSVPEERQGWPGPGGPQDKGKTSPGSAFKRDADDRVKGVSEVGNMYQNIIDARGFIDRGRSATQSASSDLSGLSRVSARDHVYAPESPARNIDKVARVTSIPGNTSPRDHTYAPESPVLSRGLFASRGAAPGEGYNTEILDNLIDTRSPADSVYRSPAEEVYAKSQLSGLVDSRPQLGSAQTHVYGSPDEFSGLVEFSKSQGFKPDHEAIDLYPGRHHGSDSWFGSEGAATRDQIPVVSVEAGEVVFAEDTGSLYGNKVIVKGDSGKEYLYSHQSDIPLRVGERVQEGQVLGQFGATGSQNVTGIHTHIEVKDAHGNRVDPYQLPEVQKWYFNR